MAGRRRKKRRWEKGEQVEEEKEEEKERRGRRKGRKVGTRYNKRTRIRMSRIILNSSLSKWFKMDSGETLTTRRQWRRGGRTGGKGH